MQASPTEQRANAPPHRRELPVIALDPSASAAPGGHRDAKGVMKRFSARGSIFWASTPPYATRPRDQTRRLSLDAPAAIDRRPRPSIATQSSHSSTPRAEADSTEPPAMNRKLAFDNRLCYERDVARQQTIHHHKLESVLPTSLSPSRVYLDSSAPARHPHLASNAKRLQLEREKQLLIFQQNQRLADRMEHIMGRQENVVLAGSHMLKPAPPPSIRPPLRSDETKESLSMSASSSVMKASVSPRAATVRSPRRQQLHSPAHMHMPGVRLDAHQTPLVDCHLSPEFAMGRGDACMKQSLVNKTVQRRKQTQIEDENRRLKQRLAQLKPHYSAKQWDGEWQQHGKKFGHLRQDGTVGYLLPPSKTAPATDGRQATEPMRRRLPSRQGNGELPSINSSGEAKHARRKLPKSKATGGTVELKKPETRGQGGDGESDEEDMQLVALPPYTLLEATTRKGVEITVSELQIELSRLGDATKPEIGDRGFVVFGSWSDGSSTFSGEVNVDLPLVEQVAQENDDLETMIKLETVIRVPDVGNFPRLSTLLTEEELQQLLVGVIQHLRFQLVTDTKELRITCRLGATDGTSTPSRPSRPRAESVPQAASWRDHTRPKTCPSTLASESLTIESEESSTDAGEVLEAASPDKDDLGSSELAERLADVMRRSRGRRFGLRVGCQLALAVLEVDTDALELVAKLTFASGSECGEVRRIRFDATRIDEMVRHVEAGDSLREFVANQLA